MYGVALQIRMNFNLSAISAEFYPDTIQWAGVRFDPQNSYKRKQHGAMS
jgi:hypothetical protein